MTRFAGKVAFLTGAAIEQPVTAAHAIADDEWDRLVAVNLRGTYTDGGRST